MVKTTKKLTIKYATVTAEGKNIASIGCFKYLTLMGCKISQPTDADFDEELGGIGKDGKLLKEPITITPTTYQIWIAGKLITLDNCNDLTTIPGVEGTVNVRPCNTHTYIRECQYKHKRTLWNTKFHGQRNYSARWN